MEPASLPPVPADGDLSALVLGRVPTLGAEQVGEATGVPLDQARRLWRALGFPEGLGDRAFTDLDVDALRLVDGLVAGGILDLDTVVEMTRALGQTMARLADWEVGVLVNRVERPTQDADVLHEVGLRLVDDLAQPFERLLLYAWRRHLSAALARLEALSANEEDLQTVQVTVGFADIVSFTALSNRIDEDRLGDLVELFESRCHDVVHARGGRVIKSIGDSVLFTSESAEAALAIAEGIIAVIGRDPRMPDVRVGLASGSVITRLGDVFGPPVNMAARLTAVARRNRVIIDDATADLLPAEEFETRKLPARPVRGFGLVEPVAVRRR